MVTPDNEMQVPVSFPSDATPSPPGHPVAPSGSIGGYTPPPSANSGAAIGGTAVGTRLAGDDGAPLRESDERLWAALAHAGGIVVGFVAGLVVYLLYKERSEYVRENSARAFNFQLLTGLGIILGLILSSLYIGLLILPMFAMVQFGLGLLAAFHAYRRREYRYPVAIPVLS